MVNPLVIGITFLLTAGLGIGAYTTLNDTTLEETTTEIICDYNQWHQDTFGSDDDWIAYYNENCSPTTPTNTTQPPEFDLFDIDTWSPQQFILIFAILAFILNRQRQNNGVILVRSRY